MDCFSTYFTHVQTCDVTRVQSAGIHRKIQKVVVVVVVVVESSSSSSSRESVS